MQRESKDLLDHGRNRLMSTNHWTRVPQYEIPQGPSKEATDTEATQ